MITYKETTPNKKNKEKTYHSVAGVLLLVVCVHKGAPRRLASGLQQQLPTATKTIHIADELLAVVVKSNRHELHHLQTDLTHVQILSRATAGDVTHNVGQECRLQLHTSEGRSRKISE